jgi:hypothetical protein
MNYRGGASMPATGMGALQPPQQSGGMVRTAGPATGMSSVDYGGNQDVMTPTPTFGGARTMNTQTGDSFLGGNQVGSGGGLPNQDFETPMPQFNQPNYGGGFQAPGFNTQYGTLGNIQDYMNPYLDQTIERGNKNILANASARGLLGSTGTTEDLGSWASQAQAQAYEDAFNRFNVDRGYMTNTYQDQRNFDYGNFRDEDAWRYGLFTDERKDYNTRLNDWYNQMNGITNTGINATGNAADVYGNFFNALAGLYGEGGNVGANQAIQGGNNNGNLLMGLLGALGSR